MSGLLKPRLPATTHAFRQPGPTSPTPTLSTGVSTGVHSSGRWRPASTPPRVLPATPKAFGRHSPLKVQRPSSSSVREAQFARALYDAQEEEMLRSKLQAVADSIRRRADEKIAVAKIRGRTRWRRLERGLQGWVQSHWARQQDGERVHCGVAHLSQRGLSRGWLRWLQATAEQHVRWHMLKLALLRCVARTLARGWREWLSTCHEVAHVIEARWRVRTAQRTRALVRGWRGWLGSQSSTVLGREVTRRGLAHARLLRLSHGLHSWGLSMMETREQLSAIDAASTACFRRLARRGWRQLRGFHRASLTLDLAFTLTLIPRPSALHPSPLTHHPSCFTPQPSALTHHPSPFILHPSPYTPTFTSPLTRSTGRPAPGSTGPATPDNGGPASHTSIPSIRRAAPGPCTRMDQVAPRARPEATCPHRARAALPGQLRSCRWLAGTYIPTYIPTYPYTCLLSLSLSLSLTHTHTHTRARAYPPTYSLGY